MKRIVLSLAVAGLLAGCGNPPITALPAEKLIVSSKVNEDAAARAPLISPCGCYEAAVEPTGNGEAKITVLKKNSGKRVDMMTTQRNAGLIWIAPPGGNVLVINDYRVSNQSLVRVFDPGAEKLIEVDEQAWADFDSGSKKYGNAHAVAIGRGADSTALLLELHGWGQGEAWQYYLVGTRSGEIIDKGMHLQPSWREPSPPVLKESCPKYSEMFAPPKCCGEK